jgi:hypothetical protein
VVLTLSEKVEAWAKEHLLLALFSVAIITTMANWSPVILANTVGQFLVYLVLVFVSTYVLGAAIENKYKEAFATMGLGVIATLIACWWFGLSFGGGEASSSVSVETPKAEEAAPAETPKADPVVVKRLVVKAPTLGGLTLEPVDLAIIGQGTEASKVFAEALLFVGDVKPVRRHKAEFEAIVKWYQSHGSSVETDVFNNRANEVLWNLGGKLGPTSGSVVSLDGTTEGNAELANWRKLLE